MKVLTIISTVIGAAVFIVGLSLLFALPVYYLWNWLVPIIFVGAPIVAHITLFQAWGILVLCGFLFKSSSTTTTKSS